VKKINLKKVIPIVVCIIVACVSMAILTPHFSSPKTYKKTIQSLNEKKKDALALTATTTAIATAISLLPGDAGTPIADKATTVSGYLLIVLCAILFEKYVVTILGAATFFILVPLICALIIGFILSEQKQLAVLALKTSFFALAISTIIPLSMKLSNMIEENYQTSMEATIKSANKAADEIKKKSQDDNIVVSFVKKLKNGLKGVLDNFEKKINNLVEAAAVMIVTTCFIPIAVILFFAWLCKVIFGIQISFPTEKIKNVTKMKKREIIESAEE